MAANVMFLQEHVKMYLKKEMHLKDKSYKYNILLIKVQWSATSCFNLFSKQIVLKIVTLTVTIL